MIAKLINALDMELSQEEAEFLFFGLCTDTGFFRHLDSGGADAFETATTLIRCGANPKTAYAAIHSGKSLDSMRLLGRFLERAESHYDGKLIFSFSDYEDLCRFGISSRNSDNLYQLFQSITGVEVIVILKQETPVSCSVGFRSRETVDVGHIAESFGGGGHKNAAGCNLEGTIDDLRPVVLKAFEAIL
jgi:phosphoesterase RecJ-like protein